jgi:regulatory protein
MSQLDEQAYLETLNELLSKKLRENPKGKIQVRNYKAAQFAISRGFEPDLIWDILRNNE